MSGLEIERKYLEKLVSEIEEFKKRLVRELESMGDDADIAKERFKELVEVLERYEKKLDEEIGIIENLIEDMEYWDEEIKEMEELSTIEEEEEDTWALAPWASSYGWF